MSWKITEITLRCSQITSIKTTWQLVLEGSVTTSTDAKQLRTTFGQLTFPNSADRELLKSDDMSPGGGIVDGKLSFRVLGRALYDQASNPYPAGTTAHY